MKLGDTGADVRDLQTRLGAMGFQVETDGWFGEKTQAAVRSYQAGRGLVVDGIAGPRTLSALGGNNIDHLLSQADIERAAERLGVSVAALMAISEVETTGPGFLPDGRPVILFERHIMYRMLEADGQDAEDLAARYPNLVNPKRGGYMGGATEHFRLNNAMSIDRDCAIQAASWGR